MRHYVVLVLVLLLVGLLPAGTQAQQSSVASEPFTLQLGDFTSQAQLDYPAGQTGPFPTVILYHGGCYCDRDEAFGGPDGNVQSTIFKDIAQYLATHGYAVLRYNKRYINGPGKVDPKVDTVKMADTLADARTALAAARTNKRVDPNRIYLYGWSEGSQIASAVAAEDSKLAGLILQGPTVASFRDGTLAQLESKITFAESFSSPGKITAAGLEKALAQTNGWWAYDFVDTAKTDGVAVNPFFDDNKDGVLDIEHEIRPKLNAFVESQIAGGGIIADIAAFPTVADLAPKLQLPVLVLHGTNDALAPPQTITALDTLLAGRSYTRKEYPGLGHSLGTAASDIDMAGQFRPIDTAPLVDLATWLGTQTTRPATLPHTGESSLPIVPLVACAVLVGLFGLGIRWRARFVR